MYLVFILFQKKSKKKMQALITSGNKINIIR